jgi:hypothetical protein
VDVSLNKIVEDLLLIVRGSRLADSEKISKRQIESWVNQYRGVLIRQNISNGDTLNPDYIQTIPSVELVPIDASGGISTIETGTVFYRTASKLPKTINLKYMSGITFVGTLDKKRIQLIPGHRAEFQLFKKFTPKETLAYLEDEYLYVINPKGLRYITIRGVAEVPSDWALFSNSTMTAQSFTMDSQYPIPINMIPALKQLIIEREIGIESVAPGDVSNDSKHNPIQ